MYLLAKTKVSEETAIKILDLLASLGSIDLELWKERIVWPARLCGQIKQCL